MGRKPPERLHNGVGGVPTNGCTVTTVVPTFVAVGDNVGDTPVVVSEIVMSGSEVGKYGGGMIVQPGNITLGGNGNGLSIIGVECLL
jgi:hypothetical protein